MMLKKIFVAALACLCVGQALHAQETTDSVYTVEVKDANKYKVETNLFSSNCFLVLVSEDRCTSVTTTSR